mgnify:CR=1 FL=1
MTERILCVDDDPNVLQAYQRALRKRFVIEPALGGEEGLQAVTQQGPYAVVVADMRMPDMNGVEFLAQVKRLAPDTVRMMLTGNADQQTALEAVNEGHIFRFLTKPCASETFAKALEAGIEQHRLITAERELLAHTLRGSIKVLTDVLALVNPAAFGRASRVQRLVGALCRQLKPDSPWLIEIAAMLSQVGLVAVPEETLAKLYQRKPLSEAEAKALRAHPEIGRALLEQIPRLDTVAQIVAHQDALYQNPGGAAGQPEGEAIPLGSRILKLALDWDELTGGGMSHDLALAEIHDRQGWYDPRVVAALRDVLHIEVVHVVRRVRVHELFDGAILADDVRSIKGTLLCAKGQEVTASMRVRLRNYVVNVGIQTPIKIFVPVEMAHDAPAEAPEAELAEVVSDSAGRAP